MALIGDGIGHVALTGVGLGLLTSRSPVLTAVVVAAIGAVAVELIRERGKASGDIALALLFYGGISGGVFLVALSSGKTNANLMAYLFGSPLTTVAGGPGRDGRARRRACSRSPCCCDRGCSRSARTRSTPGWPACRCARSTCCSP